MQDIHRIEKSFFILLHITVVGEGQSLGNAMNYGGPNLGFMATTRKYMRKLPGRVVGRTVDADGRPCFCLTLQTREQHIRRERATSNICTNQALNALCATVYLCWLGEQGLRELGESCFSIASYAACELAARGISRRFEGPFFKEFAVDLAVDAEEFVEEALEHHQPEKIFLFPVCASLEGLEGICRLTHDAGVELVPVYNGALIEVAKEGVTMPFTDLGLQPRTIVTHHFYHDLKDRYQGTPLCWVGDIGDSIYKPEDHLLDTLSDMLAVGMDFEREDFSLWSPIIRSKEYLTRLETSHPDVFKQVAGYLRH